MKKVIFSVVLAAFLGFLPKIGHSQVIQIDGSSTVFPVTEAVAEEFQKLKKGKTKVTVGIAGTGGGFKKFCRGETDISNASRPILKSEIETCKQSGVQFIELPVAYDALTVIVNPKNDWVKSLTIPALKKMWEPAAQGKVSSWNQVRSEWPNNPLKLFGPGADSGTFDYFTEAIVGKAKSSRGDFTASEDDNVLVQGVANDRNALGYFGFAYYTRTSSKPRLSTAAKVRCCPPPSPWKTAPISRSRGRFLSTSARSLMTRNRRSRNSSNTFSSRARS
jgi:phosphate transport system substrate-binding protein